MGKSKKKIIEGILGILTKYERNAVGNFIATITGNDIWDTVYVTDVDEVFLYDTRRGISCHASAETEEVVLGVYYYLDANKHNLWGRENLVELPPKEELSWVEKPGEIKNGDDTIGMVGVRRITGESGTFLAPTFLSPDGTYATLTLWKEGDELGREVATMDLAKLGDAVSALAQKMLFEPLTKKDDTKA